MAIILNLFSNFLQSSANPIALEFAAAHQTRCNNSAFFVKFTLFKRSVRLVNRSARTDRIEGNYGCRSNTARSAKRHYTS